MNAIAVDASDRAQVVFSDMNGELFYVSDASVPSTKASLGEYGVAPSLAAGADGSLHISFVNLNGYLCYRSYDGVWSPTVVVDEALATVGTTSTSVAVSPSGAVHIAYTDSSTGGLRYALKQGGSWASYSLNTGVTGVEEVDIALDSTGNPHIAYRVSGSDDLRYCNYYSGGWSHYDIDVVSNVKGSVSIAIGDDDEVYIAYDHFDYQNSRVKFATNESGYWTTSIVDDSTVAYKSAAIAVLPDGRVSICTLNDADSVIYYRGEIVNTAPTITTTPSTSGRVSVAYSYTPSADKVVSWGVRTNAPFLAWNGTAVTGTPGLDTAGTYWVNITATVSASGQYDYQNYTLAIRDSWSPTLENQPGNGQETVGYAYRPQYNETAAVTAHSTNAPFLTWNGNAFVGTPGTSDAGTYWINVTAVSSEGLLTSYQNMTFIIGDSWAPTFISVPPEGGLFATLGFEYVIEANETAVLELRTNAPFLSLSDGTISGTLVAGTYYVNVSARSIAGLLVSWQNFTLAVVEDLDAPTVAITSPRDGASINTLVLIWTAIDESSGVTSNWYKVDGGEWVRDNSFSIALELGEGPHIVIVRALDAVGNEATASVAIYIDAIAPTVISASPIGEDVSVAQPVVIVFSEPMDAATVTVTVNGVPATLAWDGETVTIAGNWEGDTTYVVGVVGSDLSGNALQPYTWSFETEVRLVTVSGSLVGDDGAPVAYAMLFVDGVEVAITDANGSYSFQLPPGDHSIIVSCDGYENMTVGVTVEGETATLNMELHSVDDRSPHRWFWSILLFLAPCLVAYAIYRDRKG